MSRLNASPHDHWAAMGLDDEKPAPRFDPDPPEPEPEPCPPWGPWDCVKKPKDFPRGPYTTEELEVMELIGE